MIEIDNQWLNSYKEIRQNSIHVIEDATKIDYVNLLKENNVPKNIDYLQIDLEEGGRSTLTTLELLDKFIFDNYKFATVTFEHDIYCSNNHNTRQLSRDIFTKRGYIMVFPDVKNGDNPYEDWYVHPDLVDMNYVNQFITDNSMEYIDIMKILR